MFDRSKIRHRMFLLTTAKSRASALAQKSHGECSGQCSRVTSGHLKLGIYGSDRCIKRYGSRPEQKISRLGMFKTTSC